MTEIPEHLRASGGGPQEGRRRQGWWRRPGRGRGGDAGGEAPKSEAASRIPAHLLSARAGQGPGRLAATSATRAAVGTATAVATAAALATAAAGPCRPPAREATPSAC